MWNQKLVKRVFEVSQFQNEKHLTENLLIKVTKFTQRELLLLKNLSTRNFHEERIYNNSPDPRLF